MTSGEQGAESRVAPEPFERAASWEPGAHALLESISDVVAVVDAAGVLRYASPSAERMVGYSPADQIGRSILDLVHPDDLDAVTANLIRASGAPGISGPFEFRLRAASGDWIAVESTANNCVDNPAIGGVVITARDITDRHQLENAWRFEMASRRAMVRAVDEESLLEQMCRVAVEEGGYQFAWVGYPDPGPQRRVQPVARYGHDAGMLDAATVTWDDSPTGAGPVGTAIRTGTVQVLDDLDTSPRFRPWREHAATAGFRSAIGLPLSYPGSLPAAVGIYSDEREAFDPPAVKKLQDLVDDIAFGIGHLRDARRLTHLLDQTIDALAMAVEQRDPYTAGHERRVARLGVAIAAALGIDEATIHGLRIAAGMHDVGKIAIPAEILSKPGQLVPAEFELLKRHVQVGCDIVSGVDFPWPVADMILQHHERLDGSGYPNGLRGVEIGVGARVIAVADVVEAMVAHRPYRPALGIEAALAEVLAGRGTRFDAGAVEACVHLFTDEEFTFDYERA